MSALFERAILLPLPATQGEIARPRRTFDPASVTAGLAYVSRCLRGHRPFGIITGSALGLDAFLERVTTDCGAREDLHTVRIALPTDSVSHFLATCLAQLGFELRQAALDELHKLMIVFLRHESTRGRRTVVIIEATDQCGPHLLEFIKTLSKVRAGATAAMTFILVGSPGLHRILDSRGMSGLRQVTRERFDLDRSLVWIADPINAGAATGHWSSRKTVGDQSGSSRASVRSIVVMRDGAIVERRELAPGRLLIGRGAQCGLRLDSQYVSRHHAALVVAADAVAVVDLRSTNATLVNGQVIANQQLEHGDLLGIGNFRLRYDCRPR